MIKVSDYIVSAIADLGVTDVFMVSGGGAMHLDDSLGREPRLRYICNHHEQGCAMAVEGYARTRGDLGVAILTTGPGGTNTISGVLGQWHDSVPALYVSGQVRYDTTVASTDLPLRQLGDQEADIVAIVTPITKYAVMVSDPSTVRYHFEKAVHLARGGRPGPVWLDIPLNVQAALIEPADLAGYDPSEDGAPVDRGAIAAAAAETLARIRAAKRPVILAGSGIRTGHAVELFHRVADRLGIPVLTAWNAPDLVGEDHPLFAGRPSTIGDRGGNFALQNADVMLSLGCRLNIRQIGYEFAAFARHAFKIVVDVDPLELRKPTIAPDLAVEADVVAFLEELDLAIGAEPLAPAADWLAWCKERRRRYPVVLPEYRQREALVDPYVFVEELSRALRADEIIVTANGAASVVTMQALTLKQGQRVIANSGTASMGYDLPAALGACVASGQRVVCLAGDGSIQMNIQELQTIASHRLPVKIFLWDNDGYVSIRQTQDNLFGGNHVGEGPGSGVVLPDMSRIAEAYGIPTLTVDTHAGLAEAIRTTLDGSGPFLCVVRMPPHQIFAPKVAAERLPDGRIVSKPLEDMTPLLPRDEFMDSMLVEPWEPKA
jgi:acetolactate synthase-1/2/3 large subunit